MRKLALITFLALSLGLNAQHLEIGLYGGLTSYAGDLTPGDVYFQIDNAQPAGGAFLRAGFGHAFGLRFSAIQTAVSGSDASRNNPRGLSFHSDLTELALVVEVHPWSFQVGPASWITPYAFFGSARYRFNPMTFQNGRWIELQPLGTEGQGLPGYEEPYALDQWALPFGGGVTVSLSDHWKIGLEYGGRHLATDYLDDVSDTPVNYLDLSEARGEAVARLSRPNLNPATGNLDQTYRRGGGNRDWYTMVGIFLAYDLFGGTTGRNGTSCYHF